MAIHIPLAPFYAPGPPEDHLWYGAPVSSFLVRKLYMSTVTITGTVTDSVGAVASYSVTAIIDVIGATATVTPAVAPLGTTRNLTVTPSGGTPPFTFSTPVGVGLIFTLVSG